MSFCRILHHHFEGDTWESNIPAVNCAVNTFVFGTDIVHLCIYSSSPYYNGVKLWNDLCLEIRHTHDTHELDIPMTYPKILLFIEQSNILKCV